MLDTETILRSSFQQATYASAEISTLIKETDDLLARTTLKLIASRVDTIRKLLRTIQTPDSLKIEEYVKL